MSTGIILSVAGSPVYERGRGCGETRWSHGWTTRFHDYRYSEALCTDVHGYAVEKADTDDRTLAGDVVGV
jgi:hypothetical protein